MASVKELWMGGVNETDRMVVVRFWIEFQEDSSVRIAIKESNVRRKERVMDIY